jgi:glycine/D-amino acid oxidase-like deaminating enzyme
MTQSVAGRRVVVAGGGVFGCAAALELRRRGADVVLLDPEELPAPRAASTDVSKVVRREYGSDELYLQLGSRAIDGWREWNRTWPEPLYHESGLLLLAGESLAAPGFAGDSYRALQRAGFSPEALGDGEVAARFPAWRGSSGEAFFHSLAGWAESGRVVERLVALCRSAGVDVRPGDGVAELLHSDRGVVGVRSAGGAEVRGDETIVAAGVWTAALTGLQWGMWPTAHPVFHLRPERPELFAEERFPVFMADIAHTGWYGFPLHPREGVVKVARHGAGRPVEAGDARQVTAEDEAALREFLAAALPDLAEAPIVARRSCLYCDTADGHFWIDRDPGREGLTVASGGSGHGFKFAPVLGELIADAVEGRDNQWLPRFRWRREARPFASEEQARAGGPQRLGG